MSEPYGKNEGDIWLDVESEVGVKVLGQDDGHRLIHEIHDLEEIVYTTNNEEILTKAAAGRLILGTVLCPRCEVNRFTPYSSTHAWRPETPPPALSRMDNKTHICSPCGQDEAMRDFTGQPPIPPSEWPIRQQDVGEFGLGAG